MTEKMKLRQVRSVGDTLSAGFEFLRLNFKPLAKIWLYAVLPVLLIATIGSTYYLSNSLSAIEGLDMTDPDYFNNGGSPLDGFFSIISPMYFVSIFLTIIAQCAMVVSIYKYMVEYERSENGVVSMESFWSGFLPKVLLISFFYIIWTIAISIGFVFLFIPGLYLAVAGSLIFVVYFAEGLSFGDCVKRSFKLISDNWWKTFLLAIVLGLMMVAISYFINIFAMMIFGFGNMFTLDGPPSTLFLIWSAISTIVTYCIYSVAWITFGVWYYSLVEQKEGGTIINKIDQIGADDIETMFR